MLTQTLLDLIPIWGVFVIAIVSILLSEEFGYRLGQLRSRREAKESDSRVGGMVGAELGLLAFLLAFTFSLAASRFDTRRQVFLDETNAVGTTYLRAAMLPEPQRTEVRQLLREYVDWRIKGTQKDLVEEAVRQSEKIQGLLWNQAITVAEKDPHSIQTGLFVQALNEVIDLHTKRVTAGLRSRIPMPVWIVLFVVAILSFMAMGYHGGITRTSRSPAVILVALTFAGVLWLVVSLDRPGEGVLQVNQRPLIELRQMMDNSNP
jgi:hypothetical protein